MRFLPKKKAQSFAAPGAARNKTEGQAAYFLTLGMRKVRAYPGTRRIRPIQERHLPKQWTPGSQHLLAENS